MGCGCSGQSCCKSEQLKEVMHYSEGYRETAAGDIPVVKNVWTWRDWLGAIRVRIGMGRMEYKVEPGIYASGMPGKESPVCVTANYKLSFDHLRRSLSGIHAWILVLDTQGINVWCAAGKGTFGTDEIIARVRATKLGLLVSRKLLILPQLGAPGVAAHEVTKAIGFAVKYGPVYARDLPSYLDAGLKKDAAMSQVHFTLADRLVLVPMEIAGALKASFALLAAALGIGILAHRGLSAGAADDMVVLAGAILCGAAVTPILLPWVPFRAFSLKGFFIGALWSACTVFLFHSHPAVLASRALMVCALSSFLALQFTGATTFTSESGVRKEVKYALPYIIAAACIGLVIRIIFAVWMKV